MAYLQARALPHQLKYVNCKAKYPLLVAGYGSGKTHALIYRLLRFLTEIPNCTVGVYLPTVELIKKIIHPRLVEIFGNSGIPFKLNKTENSMQIWLPHGKCDIIMKSMDNPSSIIGFQTTHALIDEIDTMPFEKAELLWIAILARNRKKYRLSNGEIGINTAGVTSTPEGFKFLYQYWVKKFGDNPDYEIIRGRTEDNFHLPPDYVDGLRATYPPQLLDAYLNGIFCNLKGNTVYAEFNRISSNTDLTLSDFPESNVLYIGMDFNIARGAAVVVMKDGDNLYVVQEFHHIMDTPAMIVALQYAFRGRILVIMPDASGSSRKSVDSSKSDHRLLRDAGFRIKARKKNPPVRERVVNVQAALLNANNERHLFVNVNKCPNLTEALEKQIYDENSVPEKGSDGTDDILDALGYAVMNLKSLAKGQTMISKMRFA